MTWITVNEAALLANRTPRTIYTWINDGRIPTTTTLTGTTLVDGATILTTEATIRRGRPTGSAAPRRTA